ncbi:hypothetical protein T310_3562 [Rasamsonia emersonii CBS 393.64]|uniref:Uncharacterized protein n=1 Tax=Rasamsonia emersonii (strain ATCC 16479 / CBS 393.64 / IMI 116815) TaxID=1408163 RepID=A0A0F4YWY2_RASE3|nr:hypothetical protein T310_3562 [Rasamsonia emersonii CBS 393.64]KKA22356.1 hypothetical protein T310_3562 [Rasamsonia emersonii CBS 393.64]
MIRRPVVPQLLRAASSLPAASISNTARVIPRPFSTSAPVLNTASTTLPPRKPVGAFRGGLFGFLFGSVVAGVSVYYYILEEYRVSNEQLTDDIYGMLVQYHSGNWSRSWAFSAAF